VQCCTNINLRAQTTSSQLVRLWAVRRRGGGLTLTLVNKGASATNQTVSLAGPFAGNEPAMSAPRRTVFRGASDTDVYPVLADVAAPVALAGGAATLELPALSATVVELA